MENAINTKRFKCAYCSSFLSTSFNLTKHVKKFHGNKIKESGPYKPQGEYNFSCSQCPRKFSLQKHLKFHVKTSHPDVPEGANANADIIPLSVQNGTVGTGSTKCPMCSYGSNLREHLVKHFQSVHDIIITSEILDFTSQEEFGIWKKNTELETNSRYVIESSLKRKTQIYTCHRSGHFVSKGKGNRHLKIQGSKKMEGYCPAGFKLKWKNERLNVLYVSTHVGHENDLCHLNLTSSERKLLATKMALKIPISAILDEVRDSVSDEGIQRIHLLTSKDLRNIKNSFNLDGVRHSNDVISLESWINEMRNVNACVQYYKAQGSPSIEHPQLKIDDFLLIIMTEAQCSILQKYGMDSICIDGTHGMNSYQFELHTLLVIDDLRQGFPCAFLISNRSDKEVISIFFHYIKRKTGIISPRVFMSDMAESYYNAWCEQMVEAQFRLYCAWHVDRAWRKNLYKIKTKEKQVIIYKQLRTILQERDPSAFTIMVNQFNQNLLDDVDCMEFGKYFQVHYMSNYKAWAYCFRVGARLNTNMHLERMHRTIKYIYLEGKTAKRLDKSITAIMKFVRDKLFDHLIGLNKGKVTTKLSEIRARHKAAEESNIDVGLITRTDYGWEMPSVSNKFEVYVLEEVNVNCSTCQLVCSDCKTCIHRFTCTCPDSAIKWNMCKHVHILCKFLSRIENAQLNETEVQEDMDNNFLLIAEENINNRELEETIVSEIRHPKVRGNTGSNKKEKEELRQKLNRCMDILENESPTKLNVTYWLRCPLRYRLLKEIKDSCITFITRTPVPVSFHQPIRRYCPNVVCSLQKKIKKPKKIL